MAPKSHSVKFEGSPPDYFALHTHDDDSGRPASVSKEPIIFWAIDGCDYIPRPITIDGAVDLDTAILRPDDTVVLTGDRWPNVDAWLAYMQAGWDEQEEIDRKHEETRLEAKQKRYEAALKENGITEKGEQADKEVPALSPARLAIQVALNAAKLAQEAQ